MCMLIIARDCPRSSMASSSFLGSHFYVVTAWHLDLHQILQFLPSCPTMVGLCSVYLFTTEHDLCHQCTTLHSLLPQHSIMCWGNIQDKYESAKSTIYLYGNACIIDFIVLMTKIILMTMSICQSVEL